MEYNQESLKKIKENKILENTKSDFIKDERVIYIIKSLNHSFSIRLSKSYISFWVGGYFNQSEKIIDSTNVKRIELDIKTSDDGQNFIKILLVTINPAERIEILGVWLISPDVHSFITHSQELYPYIETPDIDWLNSEIDWEKKRLNSSCILILAIPIIAIIIFFIVNPAISTISNTRYINEPRQNDIYIFSFDKLKDTSFIPDRFRNHKKFPNGVFAKDFIIGEIQSIDDQDVHFKLVPIIGSPKEKLINAVTDWMSDGDTNFSYQTEMILPKDKLLYLTLTRVVDEIFRDGAFSLYTPQSIHRAVESGDLELTREALQKNNNLEIEDRNGVTPLALAAKGGKTKIVKLLLAKGADPNVESQWNKTPLYFSITNNHLEVVRLLLNAGVDVNQDIYGRYSPLMITCRNGYTELFDFLVDNGADHTTFLKRNRLDLMNYIGSPAIAKKLIALGFDPNTKDSHGNTPLHSTSVKAEIADVLINYGADVNAKNSSGETPLHLNFDIKKVELLVKNGADIESKNEDGITPLHSSVKSNEKFKKLISIGANVNSRSNNGRTPLHSAESAQNAKLLIQNGAKLNAKDNQGNTPLHVITNKEVAKVLIENGADPNPINNRGKTPLHYDNYSEKKAFLISEGVSNINILDNLHRTPLHYAKSKQVIKLLIENGLDPNALDERGNSPLDLQRDNPAATRVLKRYGAKVRK